MTQLPALPDPRHYPADFGDHPLISLTQKLLQERDLGAMVRNEAALDELLREHLVRSNDVAIEAALDAAPSQHVRQALSDRLRAVLSQPAADATQYAIPFAIPTVWVAGVRGKLSMPGKLPDINAVRTLLLEQGVFAANADVLISGKLLEQEQVRAIAPSQLARWRDVLQYASGGLPHDFQEAPIEVNGDGVFLRYLVGLAMQPAHGEPVIQLGKPLGPWAIALAKLLGEQMKHEGLTLFPLPRAPQAWLNALDDGRAAQLEIRFQVFVSNILRKLRTAGESPVAVLSAHDNGEIRVTIGAERNGEQWEGFVWPLAALDKVEVLQQQMVGLLRECQQEAIRVLPDVLPTIKDNLPYFPLPTELDAAASTKH